jgi:hypothetical protein
VPVLAGTAVTALFTGVLLGPSLGVGHLLYRDFIAVPVPTLTARTMGFDGPAPRAVPLDAVTALLAPVVPTWVQQQVMLVATLVLAGVGTAVLLRRRGVVAASAGAAVATWSPYAAERLLLGQAPTLLAWSMLPWIVLAVRNGRPLRHRLGLTALAAAPAALTPFGGVLAAATALGTAYSRRASLREQLSLVTLALLWCLPWLVPALGGRTDAGDRDGAIAFAASLRGPTDVIDILGGGGVWAPSAALASRDQGWALTATVGILVLAGTGLTRVAGRDRVVLTALALGLPLLVVALASPPGLAVWAWAQSVPGVALLRDTHRLLALSWFAVALLTGLGAERVATRLSALAGRAGLVAAVVSLCVLTAPDSANRLHAAYEPVSFPASLDQVAAAVSTERTLVLPWQPMRQVGWVGGHPFLDPLPLALEGDVISAHDLVVERDGRIMQVGDADPAEAEAWSRGEVDPEVLRALGVMRVVVWKDTPGAALIPRPELDPLLETPEFAVWAVTN